MGKIDDNVKKIPTKDTGNADASKLLEQALQQMDGILGNEFVETQIIPIAYMSTWFS